MKMKMTLFILSESQITLFYKRLSYLSKAKSIGLKTWLRSIIDGNYKLQDFVKIDLILPKKDI